MDEGLAARDMAYGMGGKKALACFLFNYSSRLSAECSDSAPAKWRWEEAFGCKHLNVALKKAKSPQKKGNNSYLFMFVPLANRLGFLASRLLFFCSNLWPNKFLQGLINVCFILSFLQLAQGRTEIVARWPTVYPC